MKQLSIVLILLIFFTNCSTPPKAGNVTVSGNIKGLKKGMLYLQKIQDTVLVNVDSVYIEGQSDFLMKSQVSEPEIHYLYLDKNDGARYNDRIDFFAEPGTITINTTLGDFEKDAKVVGGKNEAKFQEYKKMLERFNARNLRLIKENFEASKQKDDEKLIENDEAYKKLLKQKYLYTINFAMYNKKLEVAPYITLSEVFDANIKYLDTVANSLSPKVKKSLYGKQLITYIKERKAKEAAVKKNDSIIP
ncbi:hypothetical protein AWE51_17020 [Aquimarina aggregata]|uniref:DUF4369 domain-containing protein n=1 Tax=Aquimarina aggregata TaxID=1642818 RepID=A0A162WRX0_9FLAO|nr:DUF4369 domain-containing protein [Aquimarina aggregata]KZS38266.1 hypothetical protein AWE51_17020 [Aquimarina aggregata]